MMIPVNEQEYAHLMLFAVDQIIGFDVRVESQLAGVETVYAEIRI